MTTGQAIRRRIETDVRAAEASVIRLSHAIHADPELAFAEVKASRALGELLEAHGFTVEYGLWELPTAVRASIGDGELHVAICAEYDALPEIGHACGHNVIAAAAAGAALGLRSVADELGLTVTVLGCPAEEGGGGKALMIERGAFAGVHAAMMIHPGPEENWEMTGPAAGQIAVEFTGRAAHAGGNPEDGVNAADAMTLSQVAIGLLRQQLAPGDRIAGVVDAAGSAPNVIPDSSRGRWVLRAPTAERLFALRDRVTRCFEAGAHATGCELSLTRPAPDYLDLRQDPGLVRLFSENARRLGRESSRGAERFAGASTDMGNVSHILPTIHPMLGLGCAPAANHHADFTAAAISPAADRAVIDGAIAMAWTAVDLAERDASTSRRTGAPR